MNHEEILDRLRLARTEGVGPITFRRLLTRFGSAGAALAALPELARTAGRRTPPRTPPRAEGEKELTKLAALGGRIVLLGSEEYPPLLASLADAPAALAVLGDVRLLGQRAVAVVGARNASANGQRIAEDLASGLAAAGLVVVSGMARGVDAAAHRGALATGRTIAVVAGGLDVPYPPQHRDLQAKIAANGAVVAEAPLGVRPRARDFPRRNRIIAGLALGAVVIEAAQRSGSLITARLALDAGREIFAVPGSPLDARSRGSNDLIRQGAHLTETTEDVLEHLPANPLKEGLGRYHLFAAPRAAEPAPDLGPGSDLPGVRAQLLELLDGSPTTVDDLLHRCQFSAAAVNAALLELEIAGRVELLPGDRVARCPGGRA